jgi:hypothetical protein
MTKARRAAAARKGWRSRKARGGKRRSYRKNKSRRRTTRRRTYRRNKGLKSLFGFRKNAMPNWKMVFKNGALITAGVVGQKVLQGILSKFVFDKLFGAPPTPVAPVATPPAVEGLGALAEYKGPISGFVATAVGIALTNWVVKDAHTRIMVSGGMAASFVHTVLVDVLARIRPDWAGAISAYDDSTAARLSAMYGLGQYDVARASIQPHYRPIGEYFTEPVSGLGADAYQAAAGVGQLYQAAAGVGQYGPNPDVYQAAAGVGAQEYVGNHINPASNLDRELDILEAAAGVGEYFTEPVSGLGEYLDSSNGGIATVPRADTWVPGTTDPELWAGVRGITKPQGADANVPAGIMQTDGGSGIFG